MLDFLYRIDLGVNLKEKPFSFKFKDPGKQFNFHGNNYRENYRSKFITKSDLGYIVCCLKQKYDSMN